MRYARFVDRHDDIIVPKDIDLLGPALDSCVVHGRLTTRVLGKRSEEIRIEKVHLVRRNIRLVEEVAWRVSDNLNELGLGNIHHVEIDETVVHELFFV